MAVCKKLLLDFLNEFKFKIKFIEELSKEEITFSLNTYNVFIKSEIPLLVCLCYIEGLCKVCYKKRRDDMRSWFYFRKALSKLSDIPIFDALHPEILFEDLPKNKKNKALIKSCRSFLRDLDKKKKFYTRRYFLQLIKLSSMPNNVKVFLKKEIKNGHGTYASLAYKELRNKVVHELEHIPLSFSEITFKGKQVPPLNFDICYKALNNIYKNVKSRLLAGNP